MLKATIFAALFVFNVAFSFKGCPPGKPMAMCSGPPCGNVLERICHESFCGICTATCYKITNIIPEVIPCTFLRGNIFRNRFGMRGKQGKKFS